MRPGSTQTALAGRERERELFLRELEAAATGRPRLLLFEGEPGIGRTALLDEIEASPMLPGGRIRVVRLDLLDQPDADPVVLAARAASRYGMYERLGGRRRIGALAGKLLPEWLGAIPGVGDVLEAIAATAEAVRKRRRQPQRAQQTRAEDVEALIAVARRRPLALLIDDLHACGEAAVERVRRLVADAETGVRLIVVATCRAPRLGAARHAAHRLSERLPGDRLVHHRLEPLSRDELREWLDPERPGLGPETIDRLLEETGGVPGLVVASLDRPDQDDTTAAAPAAESGFDDVELPDQVVAALRAAADLPPEFDALALAERLGADELEIEDRLAVAVRAGALANLGVVERPDGELSTRFRFTSSALRARFHRAEAAHTASLIARGEGAD